MSPHHTKAPWNPRAGNPCLDEQEEREEEARQGKPTHFQAYDNSLGSGVMLSWQDFDHACACVNALAGIPDPAAFVAAVRELVEKRPGGRAWSHSIRRSAFEKAFDRLAAMLKGDTDEK